MKKNVLITGTSTGVGLESTILFAKKGYKVFATMRNLNKAETLKKVILEEKLDIELLELDVTKNETIERTVKYIIDNYKRIDILINNAGAGFSKTLEQATFDEINWVTEVNYLGVVRTTRAVLPYMRTVKQGRIINISSVGGLVGQPFNELYCAAKFAVEGFTEALATYISDPFNIYFSIVEPGGITTEFMSNAIQKTVNEKGDFATGEYAPIFNKYLEGVQKRAENSKNSPYQTGKEVASVILSVAENEHPPLRIRTSEWAEKFTHLKTATDPSGSLILESVKKDIL